MEKRKENDKDGESGAEAPADWMPDRNLLSSSVSKKGAGVLAWAIMMPQNHCPIGRKRPFL